MQKKCRFRGTANPTLLKNSKIFLKGDFKNKIKAIPIVVKKLEGKKLYNFII